MGCSAVVVSFRPRRVGKDVGDRSALSATVVQNRRSAAAADGSAHRAVHVCFGGKLPSDRAIDSGIDRILAEQLVNRKIAHTTVLSAISYKKSITLVPSREVILLSRTLKAILFKEGGEKDSTPRRTGADRIGRLGPVA